jgi:hypothetical protein
VFLEPDPFATFCGAINKIEVSFIQHCSLFLKRCTQQLMEGKTDFNVGYSTGKFNYFPANARLTEKDKYVTDASVSLFLKSPSVCK